MGVNHGGGNVFVSEEFLNGANIVTAFKEVGGKAMSKRMAAGGLGKASGANGFLDRVLQILFASVVASSISAPRVYGQVVRRKNVLPSPLSGGARVFSVQGRGKVNGATPPTQILSVQFLDSCQMGLERSTQPLRQQGHSLPQPLAFADGDLAVAEIDVLDPQPQTFQKPQSTSIEQVAHEPVVAFESRENGVRFHPSEDDWNFWRPFGALEVYELKLAFQHLLIQKKQGAQSLILRRSADPAVDGKMRKESRDFLFAHIVGVALAVEQDEPLDPIQIRLLGPDAVTFDAEMPPDAIE
jgi:hypothetical protein